MLYDFFARIIVANGLFTTADFLRIVTRSRLLVEKFVTFCGKSLISQQLTLAVPNLR